MQCKNILFTFLLCLPYLVTTDESFILEYTPENFKKQIELKDGNFIMFYAPWCKHCTNFHPIWHELAELVNTPESNFAIAQVDCTVYPKLCNENEITGYPTLMYFHKNSLHPVEYKGTRDMPSLTLFLSEVFSMKAEEEAKTQTKDGVTVYGGVAYLNDHNIEKFISKGQHFILFYVPWCKQCQRMAPLWAELGVFYTHNEYIQVGKINCQDNTITCQNFDVSQYPSMLWIVNGRIMGQAFEEGLVGLKTYVEMMLLTENHDPEKFMKKKKALPVARITEETFETFLDKELVFINYFAPWCAHCMQLSPLWQQLGERFQNDSRVLIADVDCARSKPICLVEKISGHPTLVLYRDKQIVMTETGSKSLETLIAIVKEQLDGPITTAEFEVRPETDDETKRVIVTTKTKQEKNQDEEDKSNEKQIKESQAKDEL